MAQTLQKASEGPYSSQGCSHLPPFQTRTLNAREGSTLLSTRTPLEAALTPSWQSHTPTPTCSPSLVSMIVLHVLLGPPGDLTGNRGFVSLRRKKLPTTDCLSQTSQVFRNSARGEGTGGQCSGEATRLQEVQSWKCRLPGLASAPVPSAAWPMGRSSPPALHCLLAQKSPSIC